MTATVDATAAQRYVEDIIKLHDRISVGNLRDALAGDPIHVLEPGDGSLTISVRESQVPDRYPRLLLGFRLTQYARIGWINPEFIFRRALFHEQRRAAGETTHTVCLCTATGKIRGYISLSGSEDPQPLALDSPSRSRFPVEIAHGIDLLTPYSAPGWTTHDVFEGKRFIRDYAMPPGPLATRVPWHVLLGFGRTLVHLGGTRPRCSSSATASSGT